MARSPGSSSSTRLTTNASAPGIAAWQAKSAGASPNSVPSGSGPGAPRRGRSGSRAHDPTRDGSQARIFSTTAPCTSVRRKSRPWNWKVSRVWSMPRQCRIVAFRSWTWTGSADDVVAEVVGLAVGDARLDAAAGQPDGEAARMMVAAVVVGGQRALAVDGAAELAAPDDQRVVEQAALLQVRDQRGGGLVDVAALAGDLRGQVACAGPSRGGRAGRSARRARPAGGRAGSWRRRCRACATSGPYRSKTCSGSSREVGQLRDRGLHAEGHLVLGDPRGDLRVADLVDA